MRWTFPKSLYLAVSLSIGKFKRVDISRYFTDITAFPLSMVSTCTCQILTQINIFQTVQSNWGPGCSCPFAELQIASFKGVCHTFTLFRSLGTRPGNHSGSSLDARVKILSMSFRSSICNKYSGFRVQDCNSLVPHSTPSMHPRESETG